MSGFKSFIFVQDQLSWHIHKTNLTKFVSNNHLVRALHKWILVWPLIDSPCLYCRFQIFDNCDSIYIFKTCCTNLFYVAFVLGSQFFLLDFVYCKHYFVHYHQIEALVQKSKWLRKHIQVLVWVSNSFPIIFRLNFGSLKLRLNIRRLRLQFIIHIYNS